MITSIAKILTTISLKLNFDLLQEIFIKIDDLHKSNLKIKAYNNLNWLYKQLLTVKRYMVDQNG